MLNLQRVCVSQELHGTDMMNPFPLDDRVLNVRGSDQLSTKQETEGARKMTGKQRQRENLVFPFETMVVSVVCRCHVGWPGDG